MLGHKDVFKPGLSNSNTWWANESLRKSSKQSLIQSNKKPNIAHMQIEFQIKKNVIYVSKNC